MGQAVSPDGSEQQLKELLEAKSEILRLRAQVRRVKEERYLLKKSRAVLCQGTRVKYRFMIEHRGEYAIALMCRVLRVARAGFYEWIRASVPDRAKEDARLFNLIRYSYAASHGVYGARRVCLTSCRAEWGRTKITERIMRDYRNRKVHLGDRVQLWEGRRGLIVCDFDDKKFSLEYPQSKWGHLNEGILIKMDGGGILYYPCTDEDLEIV